MTKIWFITGTSRGFGRSWTEAALERGDKVAGRQGYQAPAPSTTAAAVLAVADAVVDAENPPLRLLLSSLAYDIAQNAYTQRQQTWPEWESTSRTAS